MKRIVYSILFFGFLLGCVSPEIGSSEGTCNTGIYTLTGDYPGARLGRCHVRGERSVHLVNSPENEPINHSPWYGFKVQGGDGRLRVSIRYTTHEHRYWPKYSTDGKRWRPVPPDWVNVSSDKQTLNLNLSIGGSPMWISAQENLTADWYEEWELALADKYPSVHRGNIGSSIAGHLLTSFQTNPDSDNVILLVGRQHPPEVTGAYGMRFFVNRLLEGAPSICRDEQPLCKFYADYNIVVVPNLNPDGVNEGHWRHNLGLVDLNRDWGPFAQLETQNVLKLIDGLVAGGKTITLFLDFHSTQNNVFYTQADEEVTNPTNFATRWLDLAKSNGVYPFSQEPRHNEGRPTSKNYMFNRFGIPAITYEVGDETDRVSIRDSARVFADAMITTLQNPQ